MRPPWTRTDEDADTTGDTQVEHPSLRDDPNRLVLIATGGMLALACAFCGATALGIDDQASIDAQAAQVIERLTDEAETAEQDLADQYDQLLTDIQAPDAERVDRDTGQMRDVLNAVTGSSLTGRTVDEQQRMLDARYGFLDSRSRVLTEFVPDWMGRTRTQGDRGAVYAMTSFDTHVTGVSGLDVTYVAIARYDRVRVDDQDGERHEYVLSRCTVAQDGTITAFEAHRASNQTRDRFDGQDTDGNSTDDGTGDTAETSASPAPGSASSSAS